MKTRNEYLLEITEKAEEAHDLIQRVVDRLDVGKVDVGAALPHLRTAQEKLQYLDHRAGDLAATREEA